MTNQATVIQLRADIAGLQADMSKAVGIVDRSLGGLRNAAGNVKTLFQGLFAGLSVAGLAAGVKSVIDYGDKLRDMAKATGASVEQLSFLDYAASQSGSSVDELSSGVARMQKNLTEVANGGGEKAAKALQRLGLSADELAKGNLVTQISAIGEALKGIQNPAERAAIGQDLFGRGFKQLAPLVLEGVDGIGALADRFVELGGAISTTQGDKFDALNDALGDMRLAARGAGAAIGESLAPAITGIATSVLRVIPFVTSTIDDFVTNGIYSFVQLQKKAVEIRAAIREFFTVEGTRGNAAGFRDPAIQKDIDEQKRLQGVLDQIKQDAYDKDVDRAKKREALRKAITAPAAGGAIGDGISDVAEKKAARDAEQRVKREAEAIRQLGARLNAERDVTEVAKARFEIEEGAYREFTSAGKERLAQLAAEIDLQKDSAEVSEYMKNLERQRREDAEKAGEARNEERRRTLESLRTPEEAYAGEVRRLLALGIGGNELQRGIENAKDAMESARNKATETNDAVQDLGLTFSSAFEAAVLGGEKLSDVLQGLAKDIAAIVLRKTITEPLVEGLTSLSSKGGGFGDFIGKLFGNASGGLYRVGGSSSEHPVAFTARAGEVVAVGTGMSGDGGLSVVVNNFSGEKVNARETPGPNGRRQLELTVGELMAGNIGAGRAASLGLLPPLATR